MGWTSSVLPDVQRTLPFEFQYRADAVAVNAISKAEEDLKLKLFGRSTRAVTKYAAA